MVVEQQYEQQYVISRSEIVDLFLVESGKEMFKILGPVTRRGPIPDRISELVSTRPSSLVVPDYDCKLCLWGKIEAARIRATSDERVRVLDWLSDQIATEVDIINQKGGMSAIDALNWVRFVLLSAEGGADWKPIRLESYHNI